MGMIYSVKNLHYRAKPHLKQIENILYYIKGDIELVALGLLTMQNAANGLYYPSMKLKTVRLTCASRRRSGSPCLRPSIGCHSWPVFRLVACFDVLVDLSPRPGQMARYADGNGELIVRFEHYLVRSCVLINIGLLNNCCLTRLLNKMCFHTYKCVCLNMFSFNVPKWHVCVNYILALPF